MTPDVIDYEKDLAIDPDQLDIAALEQTNLAMRYSKEAAHYERVAKKAHERVKTLRSQLIKEANEDPDEVLGKGIKATGPNVEAYYRDHPEYKQAKIALIESEYDRDLATEAAKHISFQRKNMIEVLAQLLQAEYFAGPSIPRNLSQEFSKRRKERFENSTASAAAAIRPRVKK